MASATEVGDAMLVVVWTKEKNRRQVSNVNLMCVFFVVALFHCGDDLLTRKGLDTTPYLSTSLYPFLFIQGYTIKLGDTTVSAVLCTVHTVC